MSALCQDCKRIESVSLLWRATLEGSGRADESFIGWQKGFGVDGRVEAIKVTVSKVDLQVSETKTVAKINEHLVDRVFCQDE